MYIRVIAERTKMGRTLSFVLMVAAIFALFVSPAFGQYGSSASYNLQWKSIQSGGNEGDDVTSTSYRLSSSIGQSTPVAEGPVSSASFDLYPGHRKIDVDYRYPFSWFTFSVEYSSDTTFEISWAGIDTTAEDGWGWGIWNYDIQYAVDGGAWTSWLDATTATSATFGPSLPVEVTPGTEYQFRIRARDLARNVAPWGDQDTVVVNYVVQFCVHTDPGLPTTETNYITLKYNDVVGAPVVEHIWQGHCAQVWCVPGTQAEVSRLSSASDTEERWMVNTIDDTVWTIDGSETEWDVRYWHQLNPIVYFVGPDAAHTVTTISHNQFGPGHVEGGLFNSWQEWTDWGSLLEFTDTTTGIPVLRALAMDSTRFHDIDAFFNDTIRYLAASNAIVVQTSFGGDSVKIDGVMRPSPYYTDWFDMSVHLLEAKDTVWISACEIWIFANWEDAPAAPRIRNVTIVSDSVFTAVYRHEFKFTLTNPSGFGTPVPPVGEYWHDAGDTVTGSISPLIVGSSALVGYIGTGSVASGGGDSYWFEINACSSVEWLWAPISEMCTLWVFSPYGHPSPDGMWVVPCGTEITCSVEESTFVDGVWHRNSGWRGDGIVIPATGTDNEVFVRVIGTGWLVWEWEDDWMPLIVGSEPSYHGYPVPDTGIHWMNYSTVVDAWVTNPDGTWLCTGYETNWWGSLPASSADSVHFMLEAPTFLDWQWVFSPPELCTLWVFSSVGSPMPSVGMHLYPVGHTVTAYVPSPDGPYTCTGWTGTGSVPISGTTNSVTFTITGTSTITWQWDGVTMVPFVVVNPGGHDSPVPPEGIHYYPFGTTVNASVTSPDGSWYCIGFEGYGDVPASGVTDAVDFVITVPSGITWQWSNDVVSLDVIAPPYADADPPVGRTWHPRGRVITATVIDTLYEAADRRHACSGWIGDGVVVPATGALPTATFTMTGNGTIDWQYDNQYLLSLDFTGLPGGVVPGTLDLEGWYNEGDSARLETDSVVWDGGTPYAFMFWDDGEAPTVIGDPLSDSTWILMDWAYEITAVFERGVLIEIVKTPEHESPGWILVDGDTVATGHYYDMWVIGSSHTIEVSAIDSTDTIRYVFDAWRDGVSGASRIVAPITDTIFYADYFTDYHYILTKTPVADTLGRLVIDGTVHGGLASVRQDRWWREGTNHDVAVSERDSLGFEKYIFQNWSDGVTTSARTIGPIAHHDSISAIYQPQYMVRVEKNPLENHGSIYIDGVAYPGVALMEFWANSGSIFDIGVSKFDTTGDSLYRFVDWTDGPTDTMRSTGTIDAPAVFTANYDPLSVRVRIEVSQRGIYPCDSLFWDIRDSLEWEQTVTMSQRDSLKIFNLSNVPVDFGLRIGEIFDTTESWHPDPYWSPGLSSDNNKFVLRARFDDSPEPPITWWLTRDFVIETIYWAKNEGAGSTGIFGPGGENVPAYDDPNYTEKLWLQFKAPRSGNHPEHTRAIVLNLVARMHLD